MRVTLEKNGLSGSIDLPAPETEIKSFRENMGTTDPADNSFRIADVLPDFQAGLCLCGQTVDLDHLNLLARTVDGLDAYERRQFEAGAMYMGIDNLRGLVNLTQNTSHFSLVTPDDTLRDIGFHHYMNLHGGIAADEIEKTDFAGIGLRLIQSGEGYPTPYGVVYENETPVFDFFDGEHMPVYYDETDSIGVLMKYGGEEEFLQLPVPESAIDRAAARLGADDAKLCGIEVDSDPDEELLKSCPDIKALNRYLQDEQLAESDPPSMRVNVFQLNGDPRRLKFMEYELLSFSFDRSFLFFEFVSVFLAFHKFCKIPIFQF